MKKLLCMCILACAAMCSAAPVAAQPGRVLRLTANYWEPYTGADLPRQGIASEIVATALERAGYAVEISFMPWSRALASAYLKRSDGVVAVWSTSQRRAKLVYSDSYLSNDLFLFCTRPQLCSEASFSAHPAMRIGVGRDYDYSDDFLSRYGNALKPVDRLRQNLLKLQLGRIDMVLEDQRAVEYAIHHNPKEFGGLSLQRCAQQPLLSLPLHLGLNRDYPNAEDIIAAFNVQLRTMKKDGTLNAIVRRSAVSPLQAP